MDFIVLGPGISLHDETQQLVRSLVSQIDKPLLLDGDGLTALQQHLDLLRSRQAPTILTPHLGEMARLTGLNTRQIEADRIRVLRQAAADLKAIIVLKGAHTQVGYPDGRVFVNTSGNSGMATAGSGDVLTGAIAAMHGLGMPVEEAVRAGVFVHGLAGDLAAAAIGQDGLTAQTLLDHLPDALRSLRAGLDRSARLRYAGAVPLDTLDSSKNSSHS
jgi:NAD(P)H-hydrate epimerase